MAEIYINIQRLRKPGCMRFKYWELLLSYIIPPHHSPSLLSTKTNLNRLLRDGFIIEFQKSIMIESELDPASSLRRY